MEYWILYAILGLLIGGITIVFSEEFNASQYNEPLFLIAQQHKKIREEQEWSQPHPDPIKQAAHDSCYVFSTSQKQFSLQDLEKQTLVIQKHYQQHLATNASYKINYPKNEMLRLEPMRTLQILKIINEGLHNAASHSEANFIFSIAAVENGMLKFITHDNGNGYDRKNTPNGDGINKINLATETLNGKLILTSTQGNGTVVNVVLPIA